MTGILLPMHCQLHPNMGNKMSNVHSTQRINIDLLKTEQLSSTRPGPSEYLANGYSTASSYMGGWGNIIRAIDVFSRYLFAYQVTRITATAVARIIMDSLSKDKYLSTTKITDMVTQFNSQITKQK